MAQTDFRKQIDYLKEQILEDYIDDEAKISIIDLLSEYNHEGIAAIRDIILDPSIKNQKIKNYGSDVIRKSIKL